jgi:hypothetical protein
MYHLWGRGEVHTGFWWGTLKEGDHLKDLGIDGRIILKCIFKKWNWGSGMSWIGVGQERDRWLAVVNVMMNLTVS